MPINSNYFLKKQKKIKSFLSIKSCKLIKDFMKFSYIRGSTRESCEFFLCPSICTSSHSQLSFLNELSMWPLPFHFFPLHYVASASSLLVTLQGVLSNKSRTQQIKKWCYETEFPRTCWDLYHEKKYKLGQVERFWKCTLLIEF